MSGGAGGLRGEEVKGGVDFVVNHASGGELAAEEGGDLGERDGVEGDFFIGIEALWAEAGDVMRADEHDAFAGESGGGGAFGEELEGLGGEAGFFEKFAVGGGLPGF